VKNTENTKLKKKKIDLFDTDDNHDSNNKQDILWNEDEFNVNKPKKVSILYFIIICISNIEDVYVIYFYRPFLEMMHDLLWTTVLQKMIVQSKDLKLRYILINVIWKRKRKNN